MSKFTQFLGLVLFLLLAPGIVSAIEVRPEDYGATVDDGLDDSAAIQAAVNAIFIKGGGKIIFPSGTLSIQKTINMKPTGYIGAEVKLQGNHGTVLEISVGAGNTAFYAGNLNVLTFEELVMVGKRVSVDSPIFLDAKYVIFSDYVLQTNISRCQFYGLGVPNNAALIYLGNTDARISDSQFDGNIAQYPNGAVILAENALGLTVSRSTFIDYANLHGVYISKTAGLVGSWITFKNKPQFSGYWQRRVLIEDSRFDEGAITAITVENAAWVNITGINVNVNSTSIGRGVFLKNVDYANIRQSWFGYTTAVNPALDFDIVRAAEVTALQFGGGVYFLKQYPNVKVGVNYCPQCVELSSANKLIQTKPGKKQ